MTLYPFLPVKYIYNQNNVCIKTTSQYNNILARFSEKLLHWQTVYFIRDYNAGATLLEKEQFYIFKLFFVSNNLFIRRRNLVIATMTVLYRGKFKLLSF